MEGREASSRAPGFTAAGGIRGVRRDVRPRGRPSGAGPSIDKGVQNAKDAINPPGPTEKAGRALDEAVKP